MWIVVLDSTALVADFILESAAMRALIRRAQAGQLLLVVPEVVVREAIGKYAQAIEKLKHEADSVRTTSRRLGVAPVEMPGLDGQVARYEDRLRSTLVDIGAAMPGPPDVPHLALVDRAVSRTKPFGDSGSGYRDALIWETVLMYASSGDVVLVTSNAGDFAASNDAVSTMSSDLQRDLVRIGEADDRVIVCRSPVAAVEHLFVRNENLLAVLQLMPPITTERLIEQLPPLLRVTSKTGLVLPEQAVVFGAMDLEVSYQVRYVDHGGEEIEQEYDPLEVLDATYLSDDLAAIRVRTRVIGQVDYSLSGASDIQMGTADDEQDTGDGIRSIERELSLEVFAEYDIEAKEVRSINSLSLEAP